MILHKFRPIEPGLSMPKLKYINQQELLMNAQKPRVPPEQQNPHQDTNKAEAESKGKPKPSSSDDIGNNGQQGNLKQNTTNKSHQQDRHHTQKDDRS